METGASIPAASLLCLCVSVLTETLEAAECVHAAMLTGAGLQATLIQILVTGLAGVSRVTFASVLSDTHSVFTALLTVRLAASALRRPPAPAARQPVAMTTETFRPVVVHFLSPAPRTEPEQQNQAEPGQHYPAFTRDKTRAKIRSWSGDSSRCRFKDGEQRDEMWGKRAETCK